jgi:hypothetical protein
MAAAIMQAESEAIALDAEQAALGNFSCGEDIALRGIAARCRGAGAGDRMIFV